MNDKEREQYENELAHFGVLGMKWGVRKNATASLKKVKKPPGGFTLNKDRGRMVKNELRHPIASQVEGMKFMADKKKFFINDKEVKQLNKDVAARVQKSKDKKANRNAAYDAKVKAHKEDKVLKNKQVRDVKMKKHNEMLKQKYEGRKMSEHVLSGIGMAVTSNIGGSALTQLGYGNAGIMMASIGNLAAITLTAVNVSNQSEYNMKYRK